MGLKRGSQSWLVGGGREEGEDFADTARRELEEESGFSEVVKLISLGDPVYSYYYNDVKQSNRRSFGHNYLAILDPATQGDQKQEEHESFETEWLDFDTLYGNIAKVGGGVEHWLDALAKAKEAASAFDRNEEYSAPCFHGDGIIINSGPYNGLPSSEVREKIVVDLEAKQQGKERINYKIRDWLISRQRYWGAPIPIIHCEKDGAVAVPEDQLPVTLPLMESYEPSGDGRSPLARVPEFVNTTCPRCGGPAVRETDTMDGFACSSWYFLRFADSHNSEKPFDPEKIKYWLPVDDYIGGAEHAVMHLLYARMWTKVMQDEGLIDFGEPFKKLRNHGMILAPDGRKMSKSWGNVIAPDDLIEQGYGADAIRIMELFVGPWNQEANWSVEGMGGSYRFLQRVWGLAQEVSESQIAATEDSLELQQITHRAIKRVTKDLETMGFNTAIAGLMETVNSLYKLKTTHPITKDGSWKWAVETLLLLLAPFAPHIVDELWEQLGHQSSIHIQDWPKYDEKYLVSDAMIIVVQINGKVRAQLTLPTESTEDQVIAAAKADTKVKQYLTGEPKKTIYIANKLVSFVV
jgi:leucyl-tRNA synthetase